MSEDAHRVSRTEIASDSFKQAVGPVDHNLICHRKTSPSGKNFSRVAHRHSEAEKFPLTRERSGKVDGTKDHHVGSSSMTLDKNAQVMLASFALGAIVSYFAHAGIEHRY
jgi:hypothetical protein